MPGEFVITATTNSVWLDPDRQGEISFTVFNAAGRPLRGRAHLAPQSEAAAGWLSLTGEAERAFNIAGAHQYTVRITVPPDAPAGNYPFRLDMTGVENPDEQYVQGPTVTFDVPVREPAKPFPWWIVAVAVGVLALGILTAVFVLGGGEAQPPATATPTGVPQPTATPTVLPSPTPTPIPSLVVLSDEANDGTIVGDGTMLPVPCAGQVLAEGGHNRARGFLSYDLSPLPAGATILTATLDLSTGTRTGSPSFDNLGAFEVYSYTYDTLDPDDLYGEPAVFIEALDAAAALPPLDVTDLVREQIALDGSRLQLRLEFTEPTHAGFTEDTVCFESRPPLTIEYEP
jgi:hypothetical protein